MFKKPAKSPKKATKSKSANAADVLSQLSQINGSFTTSLQDAQKYYSELANQIMTQQQQQTNWYLGNSTTGTTDPNANIYWSSQPQPYTTMAPTSYTYATPFNIPPREMEAVPEPIKKKKIEEDPQIGVGIDTFLAEKKRQEAR